MDKLTSEQIERFKAAKGKIECAQAIANEMGITYAEVRDLILAEHMGQTLPKVPKKTGQKPTKEEMKISKIEAGYQETVNKQKEEIVRYRNNIESLMSDIATKDAQISGLKANVERLERENSKLLNEVARIASVVDESESNFAEMKKLQGIILKMAAVIYGG